MDRLTNAQLIALAADDDLLLVTGAMDLAAAASAFGVSVSATSA